MAQAGIIHDPALVTRNCAIAFLTCTIPPSTIPSLSLSSTGSPATPQRPITVPTHVVLVNQIGDIVYSAPIQIPLPSNPSIPYLPSVRNALTLNRVTNDLLTILTSRTQYCNYIVYWGHRDELALLGITNDATYVRNVHFQASMQHYAFIEDESLGEEMGVATATREFLGFEIGEEWTGERKLVADARATMALFQLWSPLACKQKMARSRIVED